MIEGFNYLIDESGNVFNSKGRQLSPFWRGSRGGSYLTVDLNKNGKRFRFSVHRLVAQEYLIKPEGKDEVNHIDKDRSNNHMSNLEWCDRSYNERHKHLIGCG